MQSNVTDYSTGPGSGFGSKRPESGRRRRREGKKETGLPCHLLCLRYFLFFFFSGFSRRFILTVVLHEVQASHTPCCCFDCSTPLDLQASSFCCLPLLRILNLLILLRLVFLSRCLFQSLVIGFAYRLHCHPPLSLDKHVFFILSVNKASYPVSGSRLPLYFYG